uniref:Sin1 middle CRIM domain-containing protein n=1 Tax=Globodera rostochiensis TaxID=31243 RepID=A0A914I351_GLORO
MTVPTFTANVVQPPRRRAPAESLDKWEGEEEDDDDDEKRPLLRHLLRSQQLGAPSSSASVTAPLDERVRTRLMAKLAEFEASGVRKSRAATAQMPTGPCQIRFEPKNPAHQPPAGTSAAAASSANESSMTSRLLAETEVEDCANTYVEYAKFEAIAYAPNSKRFAIVFPCADCVIPIHIVRTARIADLIGLACHAFTRQQRDPPLCEPPSHYDLFLAEEDSLEFDTELPPQDRRRLVADCGFTALAMVERGAWKSSRRLSQAVDSQQHQLNMSGQLDFCNNKKKYSLDVPLKQVLDYAVERKQLDDQIMCPPHNATHFREPAYVLEPFDRPGHSLDLASSVSSIGTENFVLLRLNSARGDNLMPEKSWQTTALGAGGAAVQRPLSHSRSMVNIGALGHNAELMERQSTSTANTSVVTVAGYEFETHKNCFSAVQQQPAAASSHHHQKMSVERMDGILNRGVSAHRLAQLLLQQQQQCHRATDESSSAGNILGQYEVNRSHRFQPKTPSRLVLREHCLELVPAAAYQQQQHSENRQRKTSTVSKRTAGQMKRIPWELIAAAEVPPHSEQRPAAHRSVRIIWLCCALPSALQNIFVHQQRLAEAEILLETFACCVWKALLIEAAGHEAWHIGVRLSELLDLRRPSPVYALYQHSAGAALKPAVAAEKLAAASRMTDGCGVTAVSPSLSMAAAHVSRSGTCPAALSSHQCSLANKQLLMEQQRKRRHRLQASFSTPTIFLYYSGLEI